MIGLGLGLVRQAVRNASGQAWTPAQLFANGEQGVWYEPKPQYLYQDAAGTTPVTADGDPVGLMLDRSRGLVLGPELVTNGTFDVDTSGWSAISSTIDVSNGVLKVRTSFSNGTRGARQVLTGLTAGKAYRFSCRMRKTNNLAFTDVEATIRWADGNVTAGFVRLNSSVSESFESISAIFVAESSTATIAVINGGDNSGSSPYIYEYDDISVRELPGNHATQSVAASRPTYRTDGTLHWLEFDGVDDYLVSPLRSIGNTSRSMAISYAPLTTSERVNELCGWPFSEDVASGYFLQSRQLNGTIGDPYFASRGDDLTDGTLPTLTAKVALVKNDGADFTLMRNNNVIATDTKTINVQDIGFHIGKAAVFGHIKMFGVIVTAFKHIDSTETTATNSYLATLAGVQL